MNKYIIADPDDGNISIITNFVRKVEFDAVFFSVRSGIEIADLINSENPDFIFISVNLPNEDGSEICKTHKDKYSDKFCFILIAPVEVPQKSWPKILNSGADAFFSFPINELSFRLQMQSLLKSDKTGIPDTSDIIRKKKINS